MTPQPVPPWGEIGRCLLALPLATLLVLIFVAVSWDSSPEWTREWARG
jgi:hypothetical protein